MSTPLLTVAIVTYNPRQEVFHRVLDALFEQTLDKNKWTLLVVDNNSNPTVGELFPELIANPNVLLLTETQQGNTFARQRAFRECEPELLTFVDDDNVVQEDFLEKTLEISEEFPQLGIWGPARILPEFEEAPRPDLFRWSEMLMHYDLDRDYWANFSYGNRSIPPTAGVTVRRQIWECWLKVNAKDQRRSILGRKAGRLTSAEDVDLALCAPDVGFGTGIFTRLAMKHVFPASRVQEDYLLRLWEGAMFSDEVLKDIRGIDRKSKKQQLLGDLKQFVKAMLSSSTDRKFLLRMLKGQREARKWLRGEAEKKVKGNE